MPISRGVVTERTACHQMESACGSKNAASTRVGAALTSRENSNSGDGSADARDMRGPCYSSTLKEMAIPQSAKPVPDASWDEHYADEKDAAWLYRELARADRHGERQALFSRLA